MSEIIITPATINSTGVLLQLGRQTFAETFAESNSAENMAAYLAENFTEDKLAAEINNPDSHFFIAWDGQEAVGYLKVNAGNAQTELRDNDTLEIERIYVLATHHGKKVGQLLYEKALEVAKSLNKTSIWLGVWEENLKAIRFYEKNGFTAFNKHIFMMGNDPQTDIMMRKTL